MAPITPKIFSGDPFYYGFGQGSMDFLSTIGLVCEKKRQAERRGQACLHMTEAKGVEFAKQIKTPACAGASCV
jgi:hypothetical protein